MPWSRSSLTLPPHQWRIIRNNVLARDNGCCVVCGRKAQEVDHIVAKANGGNDEMINLQSLCINHHKEKTIKEAVAGRWRYQGGRVRKDAVYQGPRRKL